MIKDLSTQFSPLYLLMKGDLIDREYFISDVSDHSILFKNERSNYFEKCFR